MNKKERFIEELENEYGVSIFEDEKIREVDSEVRNWKNNIECGEDYAESIAELERYSGDYCYFCFKHDVFTFTCYAICDKDYNFINIVYM